MIAKFRSGEDTWFCSYNYLESARCRDHPIDCPDLSRTGSVQRFLDASRPLQSVRDGKICIMSHVETLRALSNPANEREWITRRQREQNPRQHLTYECHQRGKKWIWWGEKWIGS